VKTHALFLVAVLAAAGCGGSSPVAPNGTLPPTATSVLSGQVHENVTWGDPPLSDALVEVTGADGLKKTGLSDDDGFYKIATAPGPVTVRASKPGFETKTSEFMLISDTVLNFSLTPE
jgi:Carboxypeptidase regulatory-like domain